MRLSLSDVAQSYTRKSFRYEDDFWFTSKLLTELHDEKKVYNKNKYWKRKAKKKPTQVL